MKPTTAACIVGVAIGIWAAACAGASASPFPYLAHGLARSDHHTSFGQLTGRSLRRAAMTEREHLERADAPPASLTASDGTGLELVSLRANAVIEGPLAFTELRLTFRNPADRRIEGRFELTLPRTASVSRLAMRMTGGEWQEAEVVERQRARQVYESHLHRRVDPMLLEQEAGNWFRARIFPIEPRADKEILVSYSETLASPDEPYRLPLAGLPAMESLDVNVLVGDEVVRKRERSHAPERDLLVPVPEATDGSRHGRMLVARVTPRANGERDALERLLLLVDTSASRAAVFETQLEALSQLASALAAEHGAELPILVACFDQQVAKVYEGPVGLLARRHLDAIRLRRALGASDLGAALAWAARQRSYSRLLVISDGVATAGATELAELRRRLKPADGALVRADALAIGAARDEATLQALVAGALPRGGVVLAADEPATKWVERLGRATLLDVGVAVAGAEWVWPEKLSGVQAGDTVLVHAMLEPRAAERERVEIVLRGKSNEVHAVELAAAEEPLLERALASANIERLLRERSLLAVDAFAAREALARRIVELSMEHRVITPFTALLVLETSADYSRFCIDRRALADILAVDATGVRVLRRSEPGRDPVLPSGCRESPRIEVGPAAPWSSRTTGAVGGTVVDSGSGDRVAGVTVVATSPALRGTQSAITDGSGRFRMNDLPPGSYQLTFYYADLTVRRTGVGVSIGRMTPIDASLDTSAVAGEVIAISDRAPAIDTTSTRQGVTINTGYTRQIPSGRTFASVAGAAAGSTSDEHGVSFSGTTSMENQYVVDGVNTSGPALGGTVAAIGRSSKQAYRGRMLRIMKLLDRGKLETALIEALSWQSRAPTDVVALIALGEALEANGHLGLAARAYASIIDLEPSRAEMRRVAGGRLERLGTAARELEIDTYRKAVRERPDHPTGYRLLAFALLRAGRFEQAFEALADALTKEDPRRRFARDRGVLREDLGLIAAAWLAHAPERRAELRARLEAYDVLVPIEPSLRFVLSWETDANDANLYVRESDARAPSFDRSFSGDGELSNDVRDGFGPEAFVIRGRPQWSRYHVWVHYAARAMMGYGFGQVQVIAHDGSGGIAVETRPFVVMSDGAYVDLGFVTVGAAPIAR